MSSSRSERGGRQVPQEPSQNVELLSRRGSRSFDVRLDGRKIGWVELVRMGNEPRWEARPHSHGSLSTVAFFHNRDLAVAAVVKAGLRHRQRARNRRRAQVNSPLTTPVLPLGQLEAIKKSLSQ